MFNPDSCLTCICNIWRVKRPRATFWPTPKAKPQWPDRQGACYTHHLVPCRVRRQKKGIKPQSFPMQVFSKSTLASAARKRCVRGNQRFGCVSAALPWFSSPALCSTPRGDVMRPQPPPPPPPSSSSSSPCTFILLLLLLPASSSLSIYHLLQIHFFILIIINFILILILIIFIPILILTSLSSSPS